MTKLQKEQSINAIKWIEALLSGKYKQSKNRLGNEEEGFCCWGLGCFIVGRKYYSTNGWNDQFYKDVGFNKESGNITPRFYNYENLSSINDKTKAGFKRIGKYLIKHSATNFDPMVSKSIKEHFNK